MVKWREVRFNELIQINPSIKLKKGEEYNFIEIAHLVPGMFEVRSDVIKEYKGQSSAKFENGDVLFSRITPCLENRKIAQCSLRTVRGFGSTEFFVFRARNNVSQSYIRYLSQTDMVVLPSINSMTGASGRQRADKKFIEKIKLIAPDLATQEKIANILSAYDNLIENNTKRIKLLEQAAEELYKEWFVRMRFPGYETTKFVNGIPKGWEVRRFKTFGRIETGKTPSTLDPYNYGGDIPFIKTPDMHNQTFCVETEEKLTEKGNDTQKNKLLKQSSICISCIGTAGIVSITSEPSHTNQQINALIPNDFTILPWLYYMAKSLKPIIELYGSTGATMTNLSKGKLEKIKVMTPTEDIVQEYSNLMRSSLDRIHSLLKLNQNLIKQRDLLLPRLMRGKLEV